MLLISEKNINSLHKSKFQKWTTYTNLKAMLANIGQANSICPNFKPFMVDEIKRFIGLFIFHRLSLSS